MPELLQDWVTLQAERRPDAPAVIGETTTFTYGHLERLSGQIAAALRAAGCLRGDRVCLLMPKSPTAIACILGIYKADCIYVPLDPASPAPRLSKMIGICEARAVLAAGSVSRLLDGILAGDPRDLPVTVGWMEDGPVPIAGGGHRFTLADVLGQPPIRVASRNRRRDTAHILFTSGSTGEPKGVIITHDNVIRFVEWGRTYFGIGESDRLSGHSPLHFDLSLLDIFGALASGARLYLVPRELNLLPHRLAEYIREQRLTQWFSVPSVLTYMARLGAVRPGDFPNLRRLLWCGEVFPTPCLIDWMKRLPHVRFTNLYGPTEATIASSYYTVPVRPADPSAPLPIGSACDGETLHVLDERLHPVPQGAVGDLYIGGVGLSPGYWSDEEKTRAAFLRIGGARGASTRIYRTGDLARLGDDGLIYLVGRADSQIKSRGYRIELGEIESALHASAAVQECAVLAVPTGGFEGNVICCAYVPAPGADSSPVTVRRTLSKVLPAYMLPTRWKVLDRLPVSGTGKIDRRALKEGFERDGAHADRLS